MRPVSGPPSSSEPGKLGLGVQLPARILIVDDNSVARKTIRSFLNWHSFRVCGEAADGKEALQKVRKLKPDIVLLDINLPGMNGIKTASGILRVSRRTKIVFLTIHNTPGTRTATRAWAHGFVTKSAAATELIPTLIRVVADAMPNKRISDRAPMF
jgi:DNA-binding NarL/FixJ family response regulator